MAEDLNSPGSTGADRGSAGESVGRVGDEQDPIFQRTPPRSEGKKSAVLVWQFFLVPLLIVASALAVFLLFGAFAGSEATPEELLATVLDGGGNEKQQAAHQLALAINEEYRRVERGDAPDKTPFYAEPSFQHTLVRALQNAVDDRDESTLQFVSLSLGEVQAVEGIPALIDVLYPPEGEQPFGADTRRRAAIGLTFFKGRAAEGALVRVAADPQDAQVRAIALSGLARLATDRTEEAPTVLLALRAGLDDSLAGARLNAAVGLGLRGVDDPAVVAILREGLSREGLNKMTVPVELQGQALRNASKAAATIGTPELKPLVERLTDESVEGDDLVRRFAREALAHWKTET